MHDRDIFFFCIQVCLFVAGIGIAFFRDNETGSHLDACAAKRQIVKDILMGVDASGKDDGDGTGIFFFVAMYNLQNFPDFVIVAASCCFFYGFGGIAEMASGCRTFDDNEIRDAVIVIVPKLQKNLGSPGRGNDEGRALMELPAVYFGRSVGRPAPEMMRSAPFSIQQRTYSS